MTAVVSVVAANGLLNQRTAKWSQARRATASMSASPTEIASSESLPESEILSDSEAQEAKQATQSTEISSSGTSLDVAALLAAPDNCEAESLLLPPPKVVPVTHVSSPTSTDQKPHVDSDVGHQHIDTKIVLTQGQTQMKCTNKIVGDSREPSNSSSGVAGRRVRLTGKQRAVPVPMVAQEDMSASARGVQEFRRTHSSEIRETIGHSLAPPEQGMKVRVIGDGWGGGASEYLATITEADSSTFTVIRFGTSVGPLRAWEESHVLRENCIPVLHETFFDTASTTVGKRRRMV